MRYLGMVIDQNALIFPSSISLKTNEENIRSFNLGLVFLEFQKKAYDILSWPGVKNDITITIIGQGNNEKYFHQLKNK